VQWCTGYTSINRSVVPLGLDNHNWFRLAGPKDAGVDLPPAFGFSTKQPDVVLDLKLRWRPVGPKKFQNGFFIFGRCHCAYLKWPFSDFPYRSLRRPTGLHAMAQNNLGVAYADRPATT
jgi:hypothetical protein